MVKWQLIQYDTCNRLAIDDNDSEFLKDNNSQAISSIQCDATF